MLQTWFDYLGIEPDTTGYGEKIISGIGGFLGVFAVFLASAAVLGDSSVPYVVASMGASAVLLFAAPHGKLSQPWNLIGGHLISAAIGVACAQWIPDIHLAGAAAVGAAIAAMYFLGCIHPPGGASALVAVIGGAEIQSLGYEYLLLPVGLNVLVILAAAIVVNSVFAWRRYPAHLHRVLQPVQPSEPAPPVLSTKDLDFALRQVGTYVDVSGDDLSSIYRLAEHHAQSAHVPVEALRVGHCYSNGKYGTEWSVRQITAESAGEESETLIDYRVIAGAGRRRTGTCSRIDFARWAKHEVCRNETTWQRVEPPPQN